jgi:uncharacterized membrane protein
MAVRLRRPWILFAISLALNLFFGAGVIYSKLEAERKYRPPEARIAELAEQLQLSETQQADLLALSERARERRRGRRELWRERRQNLLAELAKPELDRARLGELIDQGRDRRNASWEALMVDLHGYLATLSAEQRAAFLEMAQDRRFLRGLVGWNRRPRK